MTFPPPLQGILDEMTDLWTVDDPAYHFQVALTRRAWNLERGLPADADHESLEWLGDRVLGAVVAGRLWERFPNAAPGRLDLARDQLTSAIPLAATAKNLDIIPSIRMGVGERVQQQAQSDKVLSDHVEALVGAAFLAGGWPAATAFVERIILNHLPTDLPSADSRSTELLGTQALTTLNTRVQGRWRTNLTNESWSDERLGGPDNRPIFVSSVTLPDGTSHGGEAVQGTKQDARASAARTALRYLES